MAPKRQTESRHVRFQWNAVPKDRSNDRKGMSQVPLDEAAEAVVLGACQPYKILKVSASTSAKWFLPVYGIH